MWSTVHGGPKRENPDLVVSLQWLIGRNWVVHESQKPLYAFPLFSPTSFLFFLLPIPLDQRTKRRSIRKEREIPVLAVWDHFGPFGPRPDNSGKPSFPAGEPEMKGEGKCTQASGRQGRNDRLEPTKPNAERPTPCRPKHGLPVDTMRLPSGEAGMI
jgi:hypothetical protein